MSAGTTQQARETPATQRNGVPLQAIERKLLFRDASLPAYLTPQQVAELLQVSVKSVTRWAATDASMPVLRRGRVVRFDRERLLAWLARQEPRGARRSTKAEQGAQPAA